MSKQFHCIDLQDTFLRKEPVPVPKTPPPAGLVKWRKEHPEQARTQLVLAAEKLKLWRAANPEKASLNGTRVAAALSEQRKTVPRLQAGPEHYGAAVFHLRSPNGVPYLFKNLLHFVRTHKHLFDPLDLQYNAKKGRACRATSGLFSLKPYNRKGEPRKQVMGSWKGWTYVSFAEGREHTDLLARNPSSTEEVLAEIKAG